MKVDVKLEGIDKLNATFSKLPRVMQRRIYWRALMAGARLIRKSAADNVRSIVSDEASGVLAKNIRAYRLKRLRQWYRAGVMVRRGAVNARKRDGQGRPVRVGLYASVLEYGKKNQPPRSWLRKSLRENKGSAVSKLVEEMRRRLPDAVKEAKK